ncbi:YlaF family protein [Bacillus sp. Bos-x628]|uniref:YlaF family protein n=1 Tax=Bacillus maqinnsis TaxID=3229854 RepID=UPI00338E289B
MKRIKWLLLLCAFLAVVSMAFIGVSVAEKNILGTIISIVFVMVFMGTGFTLKRKLNVS